MYVKNKHSRNAIYSVSVLNMVETETIKEAMRFSYEPPRGKTNNVVSEQVRHKSDCTVTKVG